MKNLLGQLQSKLSGCDIVVKGEKFTRLKKIILSSMDCSMNYLY